jgi:hypothetical protein
MSDPLSQLRCAAPGVVAFYLKRAVSFIDEAFQETGYAKNHPELVMSFMAECTAYYEVERLHLAAQDAEEEY